ncbi:RNA polymerase subunit sigma-70 [Nocardioides marmotae]|uniref:RNA polymerase subunit sigma-70 n=1 Tax=Nocardioides marmotae TaxID=2663857 RepID=UPI0013285ABE|nr:RNA polymerase subunit sigma-70 [Nocardioides marmotae]MBC9734598.1 RNA polymerase subunit sigma-70 [Nocardioides marmotae]MTB85699.1 sigma-70 family RNA polymerase sigma factor [Nocardioides marmotae]
MESSQIEAARGGDELAFAALVEPFRRELHLHCYRISGSVDDADDLLQEVLVAAWKGLPQFAGRSSLRTWLYRIATTRSLSRLRDQARRPRPAPAPPFEPPTPSDRFDVPHLQPYPDARLDELDPAMRVVARESIELAFVVALQALPPRQAAALVLCDVLDFSTGEAADMLAASPTAVKGLLQRARSAMPAPRARDGSDAHDELARVFADAFERDDVDSLIGLLTDQTWLAMPPASKRYEGRSAIEAFLRASAAGRPGGHYTLTATSAASRPAFVCYLDGRARGLLVIEPAPDGTRVVSIVRFLDDTLHRHFGMPDTLP